MNREYEVVPDLAHDSARYYRTLGTTAYAFHREAFETLDAGAPTAK